MRLLGALQRLANGTSPRNVLLGGMLAALAMRLVLSLARSGPVIQADEAGYLMHARVLAGGMPAEMGFSPFYRGGYSLLLAPVLSLGADPVPTYHGVLVLNALLAASLVPLLYLLLTRCLDAAPRVAAWAAVAAGAYPSVTALTQVALSENLLFALTTAWLLAAGLLVRARTAPILPAIAAAACAALLWTAHGRMVVVVGLTVVLLSGLACVRRRRAGVLAAVAGLVVLACGLAAGHLLNDRLLERNYDGPRLDETARVLSALGDADEAGAVLANLAGQSWYLLVATLGLALLAIAGSGPGLLGRLRGRRFTAADALLALIALTTAGLLLESALWFSVRERADQLIYGRYVEPIVPAIVAIGIVVLASADRLPRLRPLAAGLAGLTLLVAALRAGLEFDIRPSRWNVASLPWLTGDLGPAVIVVAGAAGICSLWLLSRISRRAPGAVGLVVLALFVPVTAYVAYLPVLRSEHDVYPAGWTSPRSVVEARGATSVGYDDDHFDYIAAKELDRQPRAGRATIIWSDPGRDQALWQITPR